MNDDQLIERLRQLIGNHVRYLQQNWTLIEILADQGAIVLSSLDSESPIQADQYGQPARRSPETLLVPLFDANTDNYTEEAMEIFSNLSSG
ncbi:MAG: hypothetical protein ABW162_15160 [Candidatus Sedimenticola sp. PURPLELP]